MVEGASSLERSREGVGDLLSPTDDTVSSLLLRFINSVNHICDTAPSFYDSSLNQRPMCNSTLCHNHNFVCSNRSTNLRHNYRPCHSLAECSCSSSEYSHSKSCKSTEAGSGLWSLGPHQHRGDLVCHSLYEVEAKGDTSIPPPERGMAEKAVTFCESNPASHLPISTPNTRTFNSIAQSQCTRNPQVDAPYAGNTQYQQWPVGEIPTAWGLCRTDSTSNLCKEWMQVQSGMCQENTHESSESADCGLPKLPAMFCKSGGDRNDNLGSGHAIISSRQDDPTSAFNVHASRILAATYEDWGPLDLDEEDQETITEVHGLTTIPNHQYLHDRCNQTYIIYCIEGIYEFSLDFQERRFVGKTLEDVKTWEKRRLTLPWVWRKIGKPLLSTIALNLSLMFSYRS